MTQAEILWNTKLEAQNGLNNYKKLLKEDEANQGQVIIITLIYLLKAEFTRSHDVWGSKQKAAQNSYKTPSEL